MGITAEQVRQFEADGFVILDRILDAEHVDKARAAMTRIFRGEYRHDRRPAAFQKPLTTYPEVSPVTKHIVDGRLLDDDLWEVSTDPKIGEMAARLMRAASVSLVQDQLFEKSPGGKPIAFHQDGPYLEFLDPWDTYLTCWIALADTTEDMGPITYIRGSHRWRESAKPSKFGTGDEEDMMEVVEAVRPPGASLEIVPVVVPAGGGAFHHAMLMHGSYPNRSSRTRYAYALHSVPEDCRANVRAAKPTRYVLEGIEHGEPVAGTYIPIVYPPPA
ncbi:MAG TPA: phytanoyl-CoA dioxygenase family protein [Chloroflexota bacterium]|jgi:ectoine hydroxylase-related dioxygenase (phytanoyl-CoA dioxygenase family)|nr:phytanoyl-CoA dioxygenase family protein [Chloroflexota bacterium]